MPFNMFPYSNLHNLNLDWILNTVKTMAAAVEAAATTVETYAARLSQVETDVQAITPAATGAVRHDVSQSLDAAHRRRAAVNIHAVSYDAVLLSADEQAQARSNIGAISSGDIPPAPDAVLYTEQSLSTLQRAQARTNIEAVSSSQYNTLNGRVQSLEGSAVKYTSQSLTNEQKAQARTNIGALGSGDIPAPEGAVLYTAQTLTDGQKQQARTNIGAISSSDIPAAPAAVLYTAQQLTDVQQAQARTNIKSAELQPVVIINNSTQGVYTTQASFDEILLALTHNVPVWIRMTPYGESAEYMGTARLVNNGADIGATLTLTRQAADSLVPETWYNVSWLDGDPTPVLTVTTYQGRMVPNPSNNDSGKVLAVNSLGSLGWVDKGPVRNTVSGATPTITPADNNIYNCGEVTSLTISSAPATGAYSIVFTSGATATKATGFATILGMESFTPAANTIYEINVLDNRAVVGSWAVSA